MLDVGLSEFFVIGAVALLVVGPKELPALMARIGRWTGKARAMARHARSGWDAMVREAEIDEMNKRWEAENARIMAATQGQPFTDPLAPAGGGDAATDASASHVATAVGTEVEPDTFLPGLDAGQREDRDRPVAAPAPGPAVAAAAPGGEAGAAAAGPAAGDDPTDWRDPPLMRPLAPAAAPVAGTGLHGPGAAPGALPAQPAPPPAPAPAPAQLALGDGPPSEAAPAKPRRSRKAAAPAANAPAAPQG